MVGMPRERPGDKFGTSRGHPGRLGRFMWKFTFKGQNVRGTDGTDDGTDGTCPRDRLGVSRQNSLCLLVFLSLIVSQNSFVLVFVGFRTNIARYVAKWGIARMCLFKAKCQGGIAPFWEEC